MRYRFILALLPLLMLITASTAHAEAFPSSYSPLPSEPTLITNATILTGTGERLENATLLIDDGKISFVGEGASSGGCYNHRCQWPLGDTRPDRCAFPPGRLRQPRR